MKIMMLINQKSTFCVLTLILLSKFSLGQRTEDYFSEDYDEEKNCKSQDKIEVIQKKNEKHCVDNSIEDPHEAIEDCKRTITQMVQQNCKFKSNHPKTIGELLYCHVKATTICCMHNFTLPCTDFREANKNMKFAAEEYLTNKELYLKKEVKYRGFKNCYPIKGMDASKCADECKSLMKTSPLLDHCNKKNGLLKCCVRRDRVFCDECRYCCTLPFCSYKDERGDLIVEAEDILKTNQIADQEIGPQAVYELRATNIMYKGHDNRCLKPDDSKPAEKWDHYDPDDFYEAITQEELEQAKTQKFDRNFFNFEDPEVMQKFSDPENTAIWKQTYGFDYVHWEFEYNFSEDVNMYEACLRTEMKSKFAKKCRRNKGFFKCCTTRLRLDAFTKAREYLYNQSLIERNQTIQKMPAGATVTIMTYSCTRKDPFTNEVITSYKTPPVNMIGGLVVKPYETTKTRIGFRRAVCLSLNLCLNYEKSKPNPQKWYAASSRKEFCEMEANYPSIHPKYTQNGTEGIIETFESCMKRKSVVRMCPSEVLKALNDSTISEIQKEVIAIKKKLRRKTKGKKKKKKKNGKNRRLKKSRDKSSESKTNEKKKKPRKKKDRNSESE